MYVVGQISRGAVVVEDFFVNKHLIFVKSKKAIRQIIHLQSTKLLAMASRISPLLSLAFFSCFLLPAMPAPNLSLLTTCLSRGINPLKNYTTYTSPSFTALLDYSLQNLRFTEPSISKPSAIIYPQTKEEVQRAFVCAAVENTWEVRVRSGGHSYEGLSSTADAPFVIIDLSHLERVDVDITTNTAWVEAGATIGQLYASIGQKSSTLGFSAGTCPTLGAGGHFSGGGYGMLSRKYGVAADNVVDAQIIDANGRLLDRKGMGEDLFWALRGGGGGSWGIVVAWKVKLLAVPQTITTFNLFKNGRQQATNLVYKWQTVASSAPPELFMAIYIAGNTISGSPDTGASFYGQYLAPINQTVSLISQIFPELGLRATDCKQGTWIEAVAHIAAVNVADVSNRYNQNKYYFKAKSDYVTEPIPAAGLQGAFKILEANTKGFIIVEPYRGIMEKIASNAIAFPHRAGNLYVIQYQVVWSEGNPNDEAAYIDWIRRLYSYMTPFVSKKPRAAYVNYLDLDLGSVPNGNATTQQARSWGQKYFTSNFQRLVQIKHTVDPKNFFRNPQTL